MPAQVYIDVANALTARDREEITHGITRKNISWRGAKVSDVLSAVDNMGGYAHLMDAFERMFGLELMSKAPSGTHYRVSVAAAAIAVGGFFAERPREPAPEDLYRKVEDILEAL